MDEVIIPRGISALWSPTIARIAVALTSIVGGTAYFTAVIALSESGPFFFVATRCFLSGLIILAIGVCSNKHLTRQVWKDAAIPGFFFSIGISFVYIGLRSGQTSLAAFLANTEPLFIPIVNLLFFRKRTTTVHLALIFLGAVGLALLTIKSDFSFDAHLLWPLGASVFFAVYVCTVSDVVKKHDTTLFTGVYLIVTSFVAAVMLPFFEPLPHSLSATYFSIMIFFIFVMTVLRFPTQAHALKSIPPAEVGLLFMLEPVFASLLGVFYLQEVLTVHQWIGAGIVVVAISFVFALKPKRSGAS